MKPIIGIIGSSFSEGNQPYLGRYKNKRKAKNTHRFEYHLNNYYPNVEFINVAKSGKGSERFVHNVIHLKEQFDITHLLIESIEDRRLNHLQNNTRECTELFNKLRRDKELINETVKDLSLGVPFSGHIIHQNAKTLDTNDTALHGIPKKKIGNYIDVISYHFHKDMSSKIYGLMNVENTVKICKLLGIKPIHWSQRSDGLFYNDFGKSVLEHMNTWDKHFSKCSSDGLHCNDYAVDRLCQEYFKVIIDRAL